MVPKLLSLWDSNLKMFRKKAFFSELKILTTTHFRGGMNRLTGNIKR